MAMDNVTLQTPINGTGAFTFGLPIRNVTGRCIPHWKLFSRGIFFGDNPFDFVIPVILVQLSLGSFMTAFLNFILEPLGETSIVGQVMGGIILGPSFFGRNQTYKKLLNPPTNRYILETLSIFALMFFLFLIGVKTDISMVKRAGKEAWIIGVANFLFPMALTLPISFLLRASTTMDESLKDSLPFVGVLQSLTSFHVISILLNELKLLNTEMGRLAMSASMISGICSWLITLIAFSVKQTIAAGKDASACIKIVASAGAFLILTTYVIRPFMKWLIKQTHEGRHIKEGYLSLIFLFILGSAFVSELSGLHASFVPVIVGLAVPDGPPLGSTIVDKVDCFTSHVMLPLYFAANGGKTALPLVDRTTYMVVGFITILGFTGKFLATLLPSLYWQMPFRDAITLGLILSTQGIVDLQSYSRALQLEYIDARCFSVLSLFVMLTTGITSPLLKFIYDPTGRYLVYQRRTIQHSTRTTEFRILACVHSQDSVTTTINILEASNPTSESPIAVYVLILVELIGRASPLLIAHNSSHKSAVHPTSDTDHIVNAFRIFEHKNHGIVSVHPFTCIAPYVTAHNDVCMLALDKRTPLIILPFHRQWSLEGIIENAKYRTVNQQVLEKAPCSVGILVDRGELSGSRLVLSSWSFYHIAVAFLGGGDDREALAYAMRMAEHPNVNLTVVRFLPFDEQVSNDEEVLERKLDSESINEFRYSTVGSERVLYKEEIVADVVGTVSVIRSLENSYDLILVGKSQGNSPLLEGLTEWVEFPELGYLGDVLASSDFNSKVSVLVVQQHSCAGDSELPETPRLLS